MKYGYILFLDDADMTHIFKEKGKLNRIIANNLIAHALFLFFFEIQYITFCKLYLWGKSVFTFNQGLQQLLVMGQNQRKNNQGKFNYRKKQ